MAKSVRSLKSGVLSERFEIGEERHTVLDQIDPRARALFPFFFHLPYTDPIALLRWRIAVRKRCVRDLKFRAAIWEMCRRDVAFFAVTFAVIFEPRPLPRWLPFNLWTDQVSLLAWFEEIFGKRDGAVNKTRGIGLSWLTALFIFHKWLFTPEAKIAVLTKDKDLLDGPDANSLMGKFQYLLDNLPAWARHTPNGNKLENRLVEKTTFVNTLNGAVIQGFVSTSTKLRQLRFTMIFADEFAFYDRTDQAEWLVSAGGCTNNLLMVSTWNSFDDTFHQLMHEVESSLLRMNAFWWNNRERWQGAYKIEAGRVVFVDKDYKHTMDYQFGEPDLVDEGMLRSPWVDAELSRPSNTDKLKTLRDLYGMSVCQRTNSYFDVEVQKSVKRSAQEPQRQGRLEIANGEVRILPTLKAEIRTWAGVPEVDRGPYVIGCDLSQGVGSAFSVCQVLDAGGQQVLEYFSNTTDITTFAHNVVAIARWLAGSNGDGWVLVDFEGGGGQQSKPFAAELLRLNYGNIHMSQKATVRPGEVPTYAGTTNRDKGNANLKELGRAILSMDTVVRSESIAEDMRICGKDDDTGFPVFPIGRKQGHGDFVQAYGVAWWRAKNQVSIDNRVELDTMNREHPKFRFQPDFAEVGGNQLWSNDWRD